MRGMNTFLQGKLQALHAQMSLREVLTSGCLPGQWSSGDGGKRNKSMYIYRHLTDVTDMLHRNGVISALVISSQNVQSQTCVICKGPDKTYQLYPVEWDTCGAYHGGVWCCEFHIGQCQFHEYQDMSALLAVIQDYVLIVKHKHDSKSTLYSGYTMNWIVYDEDGQYRLPHINSDEFNRLLYNK